MKNKIRFSYIFFLFLLILLSFFHIINEIKISYHPFIHRKTDLHIMELTILPNNINKLIIYILSLIVILYDIISLKLSIKLEKKRRIFSLLLMIIGLFIFATFNKTGILILASLLSSYFFYRKEFFNLALLALIALEFFSLIGWLFYPFFTKNLIDEMIWIPANIDMTIFYFFNSIIGPFLLIIFLLSWIGSLIIGLRNRKKIRENYVNYFDLNIFKDNGFLKYMLDHRFAILFSFFSLLYLSYFNYIPSLNPGGAPTTIDWVYYMRPLTDISKMGFTQESLSYLFRGWSGERVIPILIILTIRTLLFLILQKQLIAPFLFSYEAIKFSHFLAGFLLIFSTYYSLKLVIKDKRLAILSIYFTTFSIVTTVGLFAGYLASWFAASFLILMVSFLIKALKNGNLKEMCKAIIFSILALFSHPWSWLIFILAIFLLLPLNFLLSILSLQKRFKRKQFLILISFFIVNIFLDFSRQFLMLMPATSLGYGMTQSIGFHEFLNFYQNLDFILSVFVGGLTNNYLVFLLSIIGAAITLKYDNLFLSFLFCLLSLVSPILFISNASIQHRLLYLLPLHIYSTFGFVELIRILNRDKLEKRLIFFFFLLLLANYSFRSIANII